MGGGIYKKPYASSVGNAHCLTLTIYTPHVGIGMWLWWQSACIPYHYVKGCTVM
jgi:hypothetical protein